MDNNEQKCHPHSPIFPAMPDETVPGLTKREYFAAMAMQGLLADPEARNQGSSSVASSAVMHADELIKALNR